MVNGIGRYVGKAVPSAIALVLVAGFAHATTPDVAQGVQKAAAKSKATGSWLQYRSDSGRTGFNPSETKINPANVGSLTLTKIVPFAFAGSTPPLADGSTLYTIGESFVDPNWPQQDAPDRFTLHAVNSVSGAAKWSTNVDCSVGAPDAVPVISKSANVMVIAMDKYCDTSTGDGHIIGIDLASHTVKWSNSSEEGWGNPAVVGRNVFITGSYVGSQAVLSINAATGASNWGYSPSGSVSDPSVGGGVVYLSETVGGVAMLTALDANTGTHLWTKGSATGVATLGNDSEYVACNQGICSYDHQGNLNWTFPAGVGEPALANGTLYVACHTKDLCALNGSTGALLWDTTLDFYSPHHISTLTVAGGVVFVNLAYAGAPSYDQYGFSTVNATNGNLIVNRHGNTAFGPGPARGTPNGGDLTNDLAVVNGHVYFVNGNRLYVFALS